MLKNIIIVVLLILVVWLSATVVRLENFRYATMVGLCSACSEEGAFRVLERYECLKRQQTRTSAIWHLWYALSGQW